MAEIGDLNPSPDPLNNPRFPEGQPGSTLNDGNRALENIIARWHLDINGSNLTTGTLTAYAIAANQTLTAYYDGLMMAARLHVACGDNPTLNVDSVAIAPIVWANGVAPKAGELPAGAIVLWRYEAGNARWQIVSPTRYLSDVTQAEAEAGTETGMRAWSPERVAQAIAWDFESAEQTISAGGSISIAHGLSARPKKFEAVIRCLTAEDQYAIGDEIAVTQSFFSRLSPAVENGGHMFVDATNVKYQFGQDIPIYGLSTAGVGIALTPANWRLVLRASV